VRFRGWWLNEHRAHLHRIVDSIEGLARSARYNADDQDRVSSTSPRAGGGSKGRVWNSRLGFETERSAGLIVRGGGEDGFSSEHSNEGTTMRYRTGSKLGIDLGDGFKMLSFVMAAKGKDNPFPFTSSLSLDAFKGTEFIWHQEFGSDQDSLRGVNHIPQQQTTFANQITGYDADEVQQDIRRGRYAEPAAIASYTGIQVAQAWQFEGGGSVFGSDGEIRAERVVEQWKGGRTVDVYTLEGSSSSEVGAHLSAKGSPLSANVVAIAGAETSVSIEYERDAAGNPTSLRYVVGTHANIGGKVDVGFAGGGANAWASQGGYAERVLEFDLTDPGLRVLVERRSTSDWVSLADRATETVRVFSTNSGGSGADAILFESSNSSTSMELVESSSRPPIR